jgi:hypothetical protein
MLSFASGQFIGGNISNIRNIFFMRKDETEFY